MKTLVTKHEYKIAKKLSRDPHTRPDHAEAYKHVCRFYKGHYFDFNTNLCAKGMDLLGCVSQDRGKETAPTFPIGARLRVVQPGHMFSGAPITVVDNGTLPSRWPYLDGLSDMLHVRLTAAEDDSISDFVISAKQVAPILEIANY